jgi:hypothetical protein
MAGFNDREKAFENKHVREEKLGFDIEARCAKIFGLWAAEQLGLAEAEAKSYALSVVESNLDEPGFEDVLRKVRTDFESGNVNISDHVMQAQLNKALEEAKKQIMEQKS